MKVKKEDEPDDGYWVSPRTMPLSPRPQGGRVKERVWQLQVNHLRSLIANQTLSWDCCRLTTCGYGQ